MLLKSRLLAGKPRILTCKMLDTFFVFTDASFSKEEGFGAFLAAQDSRILSWFSLHVDAVRFAAWLEQGRQVYCIFQVMIYIDNEGAKFALIRGYSDSFAISLICHLVVQELDDHCVLFHPLQIYQIFLLERSDPDT